MAPVTTVAERLTILLNAFSPWDGIALTHREFAAELGPPISAAAVKKWPQRKSFPRDAARRIARRAQERGVVGVTLEWVLWGEGAGPEQRPRAGREPSDAAQPSAARGASVAASAPPAPSHGRWAAVIAAALEADLSHNEFGQWSSVEVQRTVIWALKDLSRRMRTLGFDMGKSFELTDEWAGKVGLPVRVPSASDEGGEGGGGRTP
ncbi:MAG TPA: hypothetical protein VM716_14510 [Gemmatimonadales bacterium]|nr:hypothetical protein [Gemmatimonadales bacterium]